MIRALRPSPWRLVAEVEEIPAEKISARRALWALTLACGHVATRWVRYDDRIDVTTGEVIPTPSRPPRKVRCGECGEARRNR